MTNGWVDIKNTDVMLIMGGNPAENHPCGFKWVVEARKVRNAKLVVVDPRFQRTASQADLFCQIRTGTDIAFLGGLINYAISNNRYAKEYIINDTHAALIKMAEMQVDFRRLGMPKASRGPRFIATRQDILAARKVYGFE